MEIKNGAFSNLKTIATIVAIIATVVGVYLSISSGYVTKSVFEEFKAGTITGIYQRLESLDKKTDRILNKLEERDHVGKRNQ